MHPSVCTRCFVSRATNRKHILCSDCRLHTQTSAHSTGCPPNPSYGAWGGAWSSCWMLHIYFHLISSSLLTGIPKNGHFHPTGGARLWGICSMSSCTCNGHQSFVQFRSVTQQLNLFWQARSSWHLNVFPPFSHFLHVTTIFFKTIRWKKPKIRDLGCVIWILIEDQCWVWVKPLQSSLNPKKLMWR